MADEPTGNLDSVSGAEIMHLFMSLYRARGLTIILVTHDAAIAAYAGRVLRVRDGQIRGDESQLARVG
jgi:putative ABC transport system ATP-binding protein